VRGRKTYHVETKKDQSSHPKWESVDPIGEWVITVRMRSKRNRCQEGGNKTNLHKREEVNMIQTSSVYTITSMHTIRTVHTHTHTHTHTKYLFKCIHTHTHTHTSTCTHTHKYVHNYVHTHTSTYTQVCTHTVYTSNCVMHARTQVNTHPPCVLPHGNNQYKLPAGKNPIHRP
jgi:hypothetical protein